MTTLTALRRTRGKILHLHRCQLGNWNPDPAVTKRVGTYTPLGKNGHVLLHQLDRFLVAVNIQISESETILNRCTETKTLCNIPKP